MRRISTETVINAPCSKVWEILTDFASYPSWNPFIRRISGRVEAGGRLSVEIKPPGRSAMIFRPRVLVASPDRELRWLGRVFFPGIFDGEHSFVLSGADGHCRFQQSEKFTGLLVSLAGQKMLAPTELGFRAMNEALKKRAEA